MKKNLTMFKNISNVVLFILILGSAINLVLCKPIKNSSAATLEVDYQQNIKSNKIAIDQNQPKRTKRQVVQPTWLTDKEAPNLFIDQRVRVNEENLREAAAIRKAIQSAVNADSFFVDTNQPSGPNDLPTNKPAKSTSQDISPQKSTFSFFPMKFPAFPMDFSAFQRTFQQFVSSFGNVGEPQVAATPKTVESEKKPNTEFQKAWLEFMESAKKKWPEETANFQPFVSSTINAAETEAETVSKTAKSDNKPSTEFQKSWLEFIENSKQMVSSIPPAETAAENEFMAEFDNLWTEFEDNFMKIWSVDLFT